MHARNILHPTSSVGMFQRHQRIGRPVQMIGEIGYLLIEQREGVA